MIISNYRRGHAVFTAGAIKCTKINKKGEIINEATVCSSDIGSAYCIGGAVAGNGDYILAVGIRRDSTAYRNLILRSEDCGYTWNEYSFIVDNNPVKISSGTQSGTFFRTKENRLLCFSYNVNGKKQPSILVSSDNGISWQSKPIINGQEGFMEGQFVEIEGRVYCIIRHVHDTYCYLIFSNDGGQTWSVPLKLDSMNTGNGIAIMYYEKSRMIELTWVDRNLYQLDNATERYPLMRSLLSVSDFTTGNIHKGMPIAFMDATLGMDCGYQRTLLSEDGITLLVYYDKDNEDDGCCIKYVISYREL